MRGTASKAFATSHSTCCILISNVSLPGPRSLHVLQQVCTDTRIDLTAQERMSLTLYIVRSLSLSLLLSLSLFLSPSLFLAPALFSTPLSPFPFASGSPHTWYFFRRYRKLISVKGLPL